MIADRDNNRILIVSPSKRVVWRFPASGTPARSALSQPDDAFVSALPNGLIAATDDLHDRVVVIDRATRRKVWQYGHDGIPGSAPGYSNNPDGLDLIP